MEDTVTIPSSVWKNTLIKVDSLTVDKENLIKLGIRDHQDWRSKFNFLESDYKAEVARLTAENKRLRASSFTTCVSSEEYEKLLWQVSELMGRCTGLEQGLIEFGKYAPVDQLLIHDGTKWKWRYEKRNNNEQTSNKNTD